jgi:predicted esterase
MPWIKRTLPRKEFIILAPFGSARAGPGYTWTTADPAVLAAKIAELRRQYRVSRVYLFGFSAGGHIGYSMVLKHRDVIDGFIPMAGAFRSRGISREVMAKAKGLPVYAIQGKKDRVVPPAAAKRSLQVFRKHGAMTKLHEHGGGHTPPRNLSAVLKEAIEWINAELDKQAGRM